MMTPLFSHAILVSHVSCIASYVIATVRLMGAYMISALMGVFCEGSASRLVRFFADWIACHRAMSAPAVLCPKMGTHMTYFVGPITPLGTSVVGGLVALLLIVASAPGNSIYAPLSGASPPKLSGPPRMLIL